MSYPRPLHRSDKQIDYNTLNSIFEQSQKLNNIQFDPSVFNVQEDPSGIVVSMHPAIDNSENFEYHFKVETNSNSTTLGDLIVRGGYWIRDGDIYPLVCDTGFYNNDYDNDYKSVFVNNTTSHYINCDINTATNYLEVNISDTMDTGRSGFSIAFTDTDLVINQFIVGDVISGEPENDHPWHITQLSNTSARCSTGMCYLGGNGTQPYNFSATLTGITSDKNYWVELHRDATDPYQFWIWNSGAAYPSSSDIIEIYPIVEFTCTSSVITHIKERAQDDLHETLMA